ncbi:tRNA cyclic N6-threonylcarbamoyladenosine(37) synthase TcdA [Simiduia curdlanivorans]|uniref:tRNA cyclic N6-threonylcarbamoyladenosine(37) synthase TcdA n=1 Tax=Simiduia curdlanivorans TaxID=1492769 RepID=A0ABV8V3G4_9GAMM|nr:tRNA cyclic N6-threonylcarbamoyladenosine(37) synthase TcdA [Simiduia curdlanivorans]MDN3638335.1 tRNA cyclic N6-threonylcarbamoyladenosine(37) synthase TcdA [Simiduia curdlanivorans]
MTQTPLSPAYLQRFGGVARLYGMDALAQLAQAHFVVIGIGGVGSWAAEALARTGIGHITLIDMDEVCVTNTNRQLHTLASTVGQAKSAVIAERLKGINPELNVQIIDDFIQPENVAELLNKSQDVVVDCIDSAHVKAAIIGYCKRIKLTVITVGSSGGKLDPRQITSLDLAKTTNDPLLARTRNNLRRNYNFSRNTKRNFSVEAIYSTEQLKFPTPEGGVCTNKSALGAEVKLDCGGGLGAVTMVTASFGFVACSRAIERFLAKTRR